MDARGRAKKLIARSDNDAARGRLGRDHVQRLARGDTDPTTLSDCEVMHAVMRADDLAVGRHQLATQILARNSLLFEISIDELRVVAVGNEANLLAIGLR